MARCSVCGASRTGSVCTDCQLRLAEERSRQDATRHPFGSCSGPREIELWPADVITRVPVAFATQAEAMEAGETAADALWINVNRQLAEG
jgi:hypothetical protein